MSCPIGDAICRLAPFFRILLTVVAFLVLLFLFSLLSIEAGTPAYYISLANSVILGTTVVATVTVIYYCKRRDQQKPRPGESSEE